VPTGTTCSAKSTGLYSFILLGWAHDEKENRSGRVIVFNVAFIGVLCLVLELVFGDWFHEPTGRPVEPGARLPKAYDASYLYDGANEIVYTRDEWGLAASTGAGQHRHRDTRWSAGPALRGDGKTWQDVIAREFGQKGGLCRW
jgi:hypothetical protein